MSQQMTGQSPNANLGPEADSGATTPATRYLLEIPGLGVFEVGPSDIAVDSSGAQASFNDLQLFFAHDTGLARLMGLVASAQLIPDARLITLTTNDRGSETITSEIRLQNVSVSSVSDTSGPAFSATFRFGAIEARTWSVAPDGSAVFQGGFTYDLASNTGGSVSSSPPATMAAPLIATDPERYFLLISGLNGGSTDPDHLGWFELTAAQFGAFSAGLANRPSFQSLSVALDSSSGLCALFYNLASGRTLVGARIDGVDSAGQSVFDLRLAEVRIETVQESDAGGFFLGLGFQRLQLVTDGGSGPEGVLPDHAFSWNLGTRTSDIGVMPALAVGASRPADHPVSEFVLKVAGLGEYSVESYSISGNNPFSQGSGASTPDFSDLSITFADDAGLTRFLGLLATGTHVTQANLVGLIPSPSSGARVISFNLTLNDLSVSSINELSTGGYVASFQYSRIGLNTFAHGTNGSVTPTGQFSYDVSRNIADTRGPGSSSLPLAGTAPPIEPERYFLLIDGLNGGSADPDHAGWFELGPHSIQAGLTGTGPASFGSLGVSVETTAAFSGLFLDAATGTRLAGVRIEGVNSGGETVYRLDLADVVVSSVGTSSSDGATGQVLDFSYSQISLVTRASLPDGGVGPDQTFAWNLASGTSVVSLPELTVGPHPDAAPPPASFVLQLAGLGEFDVAAFSLGAANNAALPPQSGSPIVASFQDLLLVISDDAGLAGLLAACASGLQIGRGSLVGLTPVEGLGPRMTYDLGLERLVVRSVQEQPDGGYVVSLSYGRVALSTFAYSPDGARSVTGGFSYDLATGLGTEGGSQTGASLTGTAAAVSPEKYFLLVDGLNGGSTDPDHVGWFELPSFDFGITRTGSTPAFTDLSVDFTGSAGLAALLQRAASDAVMVGLRLEGVSAGGQTVYQLNLGRVRVNDVQAAGADGFNASFSFETVGLVTNANGVGSGLGADSSFGWDLPANRAVSVPRPLIAPALPVPSAGPDILVGGSGNDSLQGLDGSDQIIGNPGDDSLSGDAGDDRISGGDGADRLSGGEGLDDLAGGLGNDILEGGSGHDRLDGGLGDDILVGGDGLDTADYSGAAAGVTVKLALTGRVQKTGGAGLDTLSGIENLTGSAFADNLTGDAGDNLLGDERGGNDRFNGGAGDDTLTVHRSGAGAATTVTLTGGLGDDVMTFDGAGRYTDTVVFEGQDGADEISALGAFRAEINGGAGHDRVTVDTLGGRFQVKLGSGSDTLVLADTDGGFAASTGSLVRDFLAGNGGDILDLTAYLEGGALTNYSGGDNPFTDGHMRLIQSGNRTLLQVDRDGGGNGYQTVLAFAKTSVASFTAANFNGIDPAGAAPLESGDRAATGRQVWTKELLDRDLNPEGLPAEGDDASPGFQTAMVPGDPESNFWLF